MRELWGRGVAALVAAVGVQLAAGPTHVQACGGLFCNSAQPVNQAAERIVFTDNGDGTVTALIEIQYSGPANRFSWVLPVPGNPMLKVSSAVALNRLQGATNPQYRLQTSFEEGCGFRAGSPTSAAAPDGANQGNAPNDVTVVASGTVGPFDYKVLSVNDMLESPAQVAIDFLEAEGFDIPAMTTQVLDPYLADGLNLLAFKLTKGGTTGSIRPIVITYEADKPFIPIRPTAVAAQDDMGVMVFTVAQARAVPANYKALELNEALINWFNPMSTYNDVVSAAADEAEGQGFVTELAGNTSLVKGVVLTQQDVQQWQRLSTQTYTDDESFVRDATVAFGGWDGFQDAAAKALTLPEEIEVADFLECPRCYLNDPRVVFDATLFLRSLYEDVYTPMADTEALLQSRPYLTRLYTTMSADEMTRDPAFGFNPDLPTVSNLHMAQQTVLCNSSGGFRIDLPQGGTVVGAQQGVWPMAVGGAQPAARVIMEIGESGMGRTVVDNTGRIEELLLVALPDGGVPPAGGRGGSADAGADNPDGGTRTQRNDGCTVAAVGVDAATHAPWLLLLGLCGAAALRRKRHG